MCGNHKFFVCRHCGNLVGMVENKGVPLVCCGENMAELVPNTAQASTEKHLPAITMSGDTMTVQVGSVAHPMEEGHHIAFVYVETACGGQRKSLKIGEEPKAVFRFADDKPAAVYAYCNLHGLWKTQVE